MWRILFFIIFLGVICAGSVVWFGRCDTLGACLRLANIAREKGASLMKKIEKQCVYCKKKKLYPDNFNSEHVISAMLGTFGSKTMTLVDCVCIECNTHFANTLELHLGRDSIFGILYRTIFSNVKADNFRRSMCHKRKRLEPSVYHEDHGYLLVDLQLNDANNFDVVIANQIMILNSTKGVRINFRVAQLPDKNIIESFGLKPVAGYINFLSGGSVNVEKAHEINTALKQARINIHIEPNQFANCRLSDGDNSVYFKSVVDENIQRALAKIAFNYFVHQYGGCLALSDSFDEIRNFIRYGLKSDQYLMTLTNAPIKANLLHIQREKYSTHVITVYQNVNRHIVAQVSLFNDIRCEVVLSRAYPLVSFKMVGHVFDVLGKKVINIIDASL